jgi:hypothetical protein
MAHLVWPQAAECVPIRRRPVAPDEFAWHWPAAFMASGARRLAELGYVEAEEAERLARKQS